MRIDVVVAAAALAMASSAGAGAAADERCDLDDPELDGSHIVTHCFGYGHDIALADLLLDFAPVSPAEYLSRGLVVVNAAGRAGVTVGKGFVVEPAGDIYALTEPDASRWVAAYQPPLLVRTVAQ